MKIKKVAYAWKDTMVFTCEELRNKVEGYLVTNLENVWYEGIKKGVDVQHDYAYRLQLSALKQSFPYTQKEVVNMIKVFNLIEGDWEVEIDWTNL